MKWKKFTLETTTEAVDYLGSLFEDLGIEGMEIEDHVPLTEKETKGMFIDILPELPPDDGTARVSFYLDEDADTEEILNGVREGLKELRAFVEVGAGTITASETEDRDWINNWKQYFKPFTVDHILIKPCHRHCHKQTAQELFDIKTRTHRVCIPDLRHGAFLNLTYHIHKSPPHGMCNASYREEDRNQHERSLQCICPDNSPNPPFKRIPQYQ